QVGMKSKKTFQLLRKRNRVCWSPWPWSAPLTPIPREAPGMHIWVECGDFFREFRRHFPATGAILPSSRFLARALVRPLRSPRPACRILEVGPGTGSVTREIVWRMQSGDRLDAVEINGRFVE